MEIAPEVRMEHFVSAVLDYFAIRVGQHGADPIVACPRGR
jgi:hypothetical protein